MPPRKLAKKGKKKPKVEEEISDNLENEEELNLMDPANMGFDQIQLTAEEKDEQVIKNLSSQNPQAAHNLVQFSFKDRLFKVDDQVDHLVFHVQVDGDIILKDSDAGRDQEDYWDNKTKMNKKILAQMNSAIIEEYGKDPLEGDSQAQMKSIRNQFNFQTRASQSFNNVVKEKGIKTDPPVCTLFSAETTQWQIFDSYMQVHEEGERQALEEANKNKKGKEKPAQIVQQHVEDPLYSNSMKRALKIMERMIVQNADDEKFEDYKYYEDNTEDRETGNYGSVLPLWRFSTPKSQKKHVTSIIWNPRYKDLFAVGYGSYDFLKQSSGLICLYTFKNPKHPEYQFSTEAGVMCMDFHKSNPALLAVGLYDGTVMVFDIRLKGNNKPIYMSTIRTNKHTDPVWEIRWNNDENSKNLNFYSVASDGRVTSWTLMKNKLEADEVVKLKLVVDPNKGLGEKDKESFIYGLAGGMCFDFNQFDTPDYPLSHLFLVGTEEGKIHLCSKAYSGQYLQTYEGHYLAVYGVKWNIYHPNIFLSCSADWTIKMWDMKITRALMTFDMSYAVGDIAWAPYSSTVFAAVTSAGILYVWDLDQEKHTFLCEHPAMKKAKALHVSFNQEDPLILVGDERGGVNSFKLSNSLHKGPLVYQLAKDEEHPEDWVPPTSQFLEMKKMEKFLDSLDKHVY